MKVEELKADREKARELWRKYQEHLAYQQPFDAEIAAIYKRLAQGRTVIRALESIRVAGMDEQAHPKLAIARADETEIGCEISPHNGGVLTFSPGYPIRAASRCLRATDIPWARKYERVRTKVPIVPIHLRPKRGLQNYHVLFEADWHSYPVDPYLLRRLGGDAWLVVAAWDLTEVERAVMQNRLSA